MDKMIEQLFNSTNQAEMGDATAALQMAIMGNPVKWDAPIEDAYKIAHEQYAYVSETWQQALENVSLAEMHGEDPTKEKARAFDAFFVKEWKRQVMDAFRFLWQDVGIAETMPHRKLKDYLGED